MTKLLQKEWMTIPEAALHLNHIVNATPPVTESDVLHYAALGKLTLSIKTFSYVPGVFGYFYPRGSRPPQPGKNPAEFEGKIVYLCEAPSQSATQLHTYENVNWLETAEGDLDEIWEGPALAVIDDNSMLRPSVWDILDTNLAQEYFEAHWRKCVEEGPNKIGELKNVQSENFVRIGELGDSDCFDYEFCLVESDQASAALVSLSELVSNAILCVRQKNLEKLFAGEKEKQSQQLSRPKTKLEAQKEAVLNTLTGELLLDPLNLPARKEGPNKGAKGQCWDILKSNRQLFTENSFKEAWKELKKSGEIRGG
jgi:hypothetical protein